MNEERSTVRSRQLGDALRSAMETAELTGKRTAQLLGWSESRVSRFPTGKLDPTEVELSALLAVYHVIGAERDRLLRLVKNQTRLTWSRAEHQRALINHQHKAVRIAVFSSSIIPALLQTAAYARSVLTRAVNTQPGDNEAFLSQQMASQGMFDRDSPPHCTFFIHQLALHLPVGGLRAMSDQLHHLLRMAMRPTIMIQVIPTVVGPHPGLAGSCCLMEFPDFEPVVSTTDESVGYFKEEPADVAEYEKVFVALTAVALDRSQSQQLISKLALDLYGLDRQRNDQKAIRRS